MKIQNVIGIYIFTLGVATILNTQFPSQTASLINYFLPTNINLASNNFIRYRMILFLSSIFIFLILIPIILNFGFDGTNLEKINKLHFRYFFVAAISIPIGLVGYPFISLCTTCWTANDIFYFSLTVIFFTALQILFQAILLKLTNRKGNSNDNTK